MNTIVGSARAWGDKQCSKHETDQSSFRRHDGTRTIKGQKNGIARRPPAHYPKCEGL